MSRSSHDLLISPINSTAHVRSGSTLDSHSTAEMSAAANKRHKRLRACAGAIDGFFRSAYEPLAFIPHGQAALV
jgi:hypothetical protein